MKKRVLTLFMALYLTLSFFGNTLAMEPPEKDRAELGQEQETALDRERAEEAVSLDPVEAHFNLPEVFLEESADHSGTPADHTEMPDLQVGQTVREETASPMDASPVYVLLYDDGELVFQDSNTPENDRSVLGSYQLDLSGYDNWENIPWYNDRESIKIVTFATDVHPTSTAYWFYFCTNLESITNLDRLDTSKVTDMRYMFMACSSLTTLDLRHFNTPTSRI